MPSDKSITKGHDTMDQVGRYQIREIIGQGAMATVYRAYDPEIDRTIAIKLLQSDMCRDEEYRARFLREAKAAGMLSHPNIVTIYDVGEYNSQPYIAMELIEGKQVSDFIREGEPAPVWDVVEMGIQLARALDYAHSKGVVHRDIKPSNIMLVKDTKTIKVADFGICRIAGSEVSQQTQVGQVLGTPHYMSPEQVLGQKVDHRSDLFSVGVVLYQLLAGARPFEGDTTATLAYKIVEVAPVSLDKRRPDLPLSLRRIVDRSLKKQPDKRFQSGQELAEALIRVARELHEARRRKDRLRTVPLRVRWAISMVVLVAVIMTLTVSVIYQRQYQAMMDQVLDYGSSLVKFMATENAVPLLGEDWVAVEVFVQETVTRQDFSYLVVLDHKNIVRGSDKAAPVGSVYAAPKGEAWAMRDPSVQVVSVALPDGRKALDFAAPVLFHGKEVGRVHLGIFQDPLSAVANLSAVLFGILILVTSFAVAVGSYFLAQRLSAPIRVLRDSLNELAKGRYDYRIADKRNDEFGDLYVTFDTTAEALQQRHEGKSETLS